MTCKVVTSLVSLRWDSCEACRCLDSSMFSMVNCRHKTHRIIQDLLVTWTWLNTRDQYTTKFVKFKAESEIVSLAHNSKRQSSWKVTMSNSYSVLYHALQQSMGSCLYLRCIIFILVDLLALNYHIFPDNSFFKIVYIFPNFIKLNRSDAPQLIMFLSWIHR